jgi:predicted nucleic acid-binding protein
VLADTSVWVDHWRRGNDSFATLLEEDRIVVHPMVIGELALGPLRSRAEVLNDLRELPAASMAEHDEVLALIERRRLWGRGIGWVDTHLLASALLDGAALWTLDRPLGAVAKNLGTAYLLRRP